MQNQTDPEIRYLHQVAEYSNSIAPLVKSFSDAQAQRINAGHQEKLQLAAVLRTTLRNLPKYATGYFN